MNLVGIQYGLIMVYTCFSRSVGLLMEGEVFMEKGTRGLVPCRTDAEVINVGWSRDPPPLVQKPIVFLDHYKGVWSKGGPGYSTGLYDIDRNYTLIIHNVRVEDGDTYYCSVTAHNGNSAFNSTTVKIVGKSARITI